MTDIALIRQSFQTERQSVIEAYRQRPVPDRLLRGLSACADRAIKKLLKLFPLPRNACMAAVGGYGRGELYPFSDVDLLILLPGQLSPGEEASLGALVAALWDVGMEPGYSVRTIAQCLTEARADITVETSLLETRWIAGSRKRMSAFMQAMHRHLDARAFFLAKRAEMQQRHARFQDTPYSLEPNCKESPGGLRDLQVILWMARAAGFGTSWNEVGKAGLLDPEEARDLKKAEQAFKRIRIELHLLVGRREDRLLFDLQHGLAERYGILSTTTRRASEILMQRYYWAARLVTLLNVLLVQSIEDRLFASQSEEAQQIDEHFLIHHQRLDIVDSSLFAKDSRQLFRAFLLMQQHPELTGLSGRLLRAIWRARVLINPSFRRDRFNQQLFLEMLQQPQGIVHGLRRMTMLNVLPRYIPAFRRVLGQMQHDLFHVYTVDQHTLTVIRNLRRFTMPEHAHEYPLATRLISGFERHWLLYIAALFHDIAKGRGGDHSVLGAMEVKRFAKLHQLGKEDTELLVFLVRHHLTMSSVAQKSDLSDPEVIRSFAALVSSQRNLIALYLLTIADIRGTSPKVWNAWKGKLLEDLFNLTSTVLGGHVVDANTILSHKIEQAKALTRLAGLRDESRDAFWNDLDVAYFLRHDAPDIAWHTRHLYYQSAPAHPVVKARLTDAAEGIQIMVYTRDRQDLFARICLFLGSRGLNIQDARIHTTRHGYALDSFIVMPASEHGDARSQVNLIEHEMASFLDDEHVGHADRLPSIRARPSRRSLAFPITPSVTVYPDERSQNWTLNIIATDRQGLLGDIAKIFVKYGVSLSTAKVMTLGDRVEDVFVLNGDTLQQPRIMRQFERELLDSMTLHESKHAA